MFELWLSMRPSRCLEDDPCCSVLHALQLLNTACWSSVQHSFTSYASCVQFYGSYTNCSVLVVDCRVNSIAVDYCNSVLSGLPACLLQRL